MSTERSRFRLFHRLRVRWVEIDMQRIVFNAHYLMYFDTAMAGYWRALALPYEAAMQQLEGDLFVKKATLEYHDSARLDDVLDVCLRCERVGNSSVVFEGAIFRAERLLVTGEMVYVFADPQTQLSKPVPAALRELIEAFEAGQKLVALELGTWHVLGERISSVREAVFVQEQSIGSRMVWDDADAAAQHALVCNRLGQPVACGRLVQMAPGVGRIGRLAVSRVLRGSNLGREVLTALVETSRNRGDKTVVLHAQCSAEGFYRRLGFKAQGEVFEEAGIGHIEMAMAIESKAH